MISLSDFQRFEALKQEIKTFLIQRCWEFAEAKEIRCTCPDEYYDSFEITDSSIDVFFSREHDYWYSLPLDIVFDPDFKIKFKERLQDEKRLKEIERETYEKKQAEVKRQEKIEMLKGLMKEFPNVAKEGV